MVLYTPEQLEDMLWYFAHKYTVRDKDGKNNHVGEEANFNLSCIRSGDLLKRGFLLYAAIPHTHPIHVRTPEFMENNEYDLWRRLDNKIIDLPFDGIILPPNWEKSKGCREEREEFVKRSRIVLLYEEIMNNQPILYNVGH